MPAPQSLFVLSPPLFLPLSLSLTVNISIFLSLSVSQSIFLVPGQLGNFSHPLSPILGLGTSTVLCSPIHPRRLEQGRLKPYLRPGYFLLQSSDYMMETCLPLVGVRVHEHWRPTVKAVKVGVGLYINFTYTMLSNLSIAVSFT